MTLTDSLLLIKTAKVRWRPLTPWFDGVCRDLRREVRRLHISDDSGERAMLCPSHGTNALRVQAKEDAFLGGTERTELEQTPATVVISFQHPGMFHISEIIHITIIHGHRLPRLRGRTFAFSTNIMLYCFA